MAEQQPVLVCKNVVKSFSGLFALKGVDFTVRKGEVHGLLGENGAGKSTLLKVLAGIHRPNDGGLTLNGEAYSPSAADDALKKGVVTIHQDINLVDTMTVAENLLLNNEPKTRFGFLSNRTLNAQARTLLDRYDLDLDPDSTLESLPNDMKKMVQIVKALNWDPNILLMDEPTSSLTDVEVKVVLNLIRSLAARGVSIVFVTHYLSEVFEVCDRITILRDGRSVATHETRETTIPEVVKGMLGRDLVAVDARQRRGVPKGEVLLSVRNLSARGVLRDVSLDLHKGEILGVTGLTGSGLTELARGIYGSEDIRRTSGEFVLGGKRLKLKDPRASLDARIALLTNDRLREGVLPEFSITENVCLPIVDSFAGPTGLLDGARMTEMGRRCIRMLNVRASGPSAPIKTLSGGNQQKVLFAKWLETKPRVFLLDDPTVGIDVGAKDEIRKIVERIASEGVGIILFSTELADIVSLCDRVLVMFRGAVVGEFTADQIEKNKILETSFCGSMAA